MTEHTYPAAALDEYCVVQLPDGRRGVLISKHAPRRLRPGYVDVNDCAVRIQQDTPLVLIAHPRKTAAAWLETNDR